MNPIDYQVGQSFRPYEDNPLPLQNHSKLAMDATGQLVLIICLNNISDEEIRQLSELPVLVRIFGHLLGHALPVFRLGVTDFIFETPFNPLVYNEERIYLASADGGIILVTIEGVDNQIVSSRALNLPEDLYKKRSTNWASALARKERYTLSYSVWIESLQATLKIKDLWEFAGDQWMLDEYRL